MTLLLLIWEFFKTGLFSIGGGLATLPFLYSMARRYPWFTTQELSNMIAVSESTPGPIGINMATYTGFTTAGIPGALLATFSLVLPSVIVIILVAKVLERFRTNRFVNSAMETLRPASVGLVGAATLTVLKVALLNADALETMDWAHLVAWPSVGLFVVLLAVNLKWKKLHPIVLIVLGAAAGIALKM